ncbi:MAG: hypothetical protein ACJ76G_02840 [Solirubrobacterales bacterium]
MDGHGDRPRGRPEPRGFLPRGGAAPPLWRRVRHWLFRDRADIDQEGLLAERTLMVRPRRPPRDDGARSGSAQDEAQG